MKSNSAHKLFSVCKPNLMFGFTCFFLLKLRCASVDWFTVPATMYTLTVVDGTLTFKFLTSTVCVYEIWDTCSDVHFVLLVFETH